MRHEDFMLEEKFRLGMKRFRHAGFECIGSVELDVGLYRRNLTR